MEDTVYWNFDSRQIINSIAMRKSKPTKKSIRRFLSQHDEIEKHEVNYRIHLDAVALHIGVFELRPLEESFDGAGCFEDFIALKLFQSYTIPLSFY